MRKPLLILAAVIALPLSATGEVVRIQVAATCRRRGRNRLRPRRALREALRDGLLRGRPEARAQRDHHRHPPRAEERRGSGGVVGRVLPPQARGRRPGKRHRPARRSATGAGRGCSASSTAPREVPTRRRSRAHGRRASSRGTEFTLLWVGWQWDTPEVDGRMRMFPPHRLRRRRAHPRAGALELRAARAGVGSLARRPQPHRLPRRRPRGGRERPHRAGHRRGRAGDDSAGEVALRSGGERRG